LVSEPTAPPFWMPATVVPSPVNSSQLRHSSVVPGWVDAGGLPFRPNR
jgi:hypothetical protein